MLKLNLARFNANKIKGIPNILGYPLIFNIVCDEEIINNTKF